MTTTPTQRIALVCLGNICRSPTADVVLNALLERTDLDVVAESCGTASWHVGEPMDSRSAAVLATAGYDPSHHRARQFGPDWYDCALILVMDRHNLADVLDVLPADRHHRVRLFRSYDPAVDPGEPVPDVPDPWYGGADGFAVVLAMIERTSAALVEALRSGQHRDGGSL